MRKLSVETDTLQPNKTISYVVRALTDWEKEFQDEWQNIVNDILAVGINDFKYYDKIENNVFVLIKPTARLQKFLEFFREHESYEHDYQRGENHMIVIKLPKIHKGLVSKFVMGKYSQMYSKESIKRLFPRTVKVNNMEVQSVYHRVVSRDKTYIPIFQEKIKTTFNTTITPPAHEITELDFPPTLEEETFDYNFIKSN